MLDDRFDPISYRTQLLSALGVCSGLSEKHNRDLVPFFLTRADPPSTLPRQQLTSWLNVFEKFTNPKALRSTEVLHSLYLTLLCHPDRSLQRLALSCLLLGAKSCKVLLCSLVEHAVTANRETAGWMHPDATANRRD